MQKQIKTAGDLRGFLAEVLVSVRDGSIDANKANAISKVAAQINQSLATEVTTKLKLKELGVDGAGEMLIGPREADAPGLLDSSEDEPEPEPEPDPTESAPHVAIVSRAEGDATATAALNRADRDKVWCDQCEMRVAVSQAVACKSKYCTAKAVA